jgi:hypothetical protein
MEKGKNICLWSDMNYRGSLKRRRWILVVSFTATTSLYGGDLQLWETGGMYFGLPYTKGTVEADYNFWHEDGSPGMSLYGSYAFTDNFTLKLEVPGEFESPVFYGAKVTALLGQTDTSGGWTVSADFSAEAYGGEKWSDITAIAGVNGGRRWGAFALLGRLSGGAERYREEGEPDITAIFEGEVGPFVYTGDFGMAGIPVMTEYRYSSFSMNIALDWEIYLPFSISLWFVPRYEVLGESGFSIWCGVAWMR